MINAFITFFFLIFEHIVWYFFRGNAFLSTSDRPEFRSEMPAGNYTVWSTVSNLMVRCPQTRPLEAVMTLSTPSSVRPELANTYPGLSLLIWNQL